MNIRIAKISAENCGPVKKINIAPCNLTIFYGRNEDGKSFLVEFIIRCLFKNKKPWGDLRQAGGGKITLTGIKDKPVDFIPDKGVKLEDYFERDSRGLPLSLLNLLVVKEGETGIGNNKEELTKDIVKTFLSSRRLLDEIDGKILVTLKDAKIDTDIEIDKRGGRDYYNKLEEIKKIDNIIYSLNNQSAHWLIRDLSLQENQLKCKKELLNRARKFKAYTLSTKIKAVEKQLEKIPRETISELKELYNEYKKTQEKYELLKHELADIQKETELIPGLENKKELLLKAKRYQAYQLASEIKNIEEKLRSLPETELNKLENNISIYRNKKNELESCKKSINQASEKSADYHWLKTAKENYHRFLSTTGPNKKVSRAFPVAAGLTFITGIVTLLLNQKIPGLIILIISALLTLLYFIFLKKSYSSLRLSEELEQIESEFRKRFGEELENITKLESIFNEEEKYFNQLEVYNTQLIRLSTETDSYFKLIQEMFAGFGIDNPPEEKWEEFISVIRQNREDLTSKYDLLNRKLASLDTDETEYEIKDPGVKFERNELEEIKEHLTRLYELKKQENKKIQERNELINSLKVTGEVITEKFRSLTEEEIAEEEWTSKIKLLENQYNNLLSYYESLKGQLTGLGVSESDFEKEDPGIEYSPEEMEKIEKKMEEISEKLKNEEERFATLKGEIISITGAETSAKWTDLVDMLYRKKQEIKDEIEGIKASIIAGKLLHLTIQELQLEEDQKLEEALNSKEVTSVLQNLTGHYNALSFDDKKIIISDGYNNYYLKDLSTGALEQVMIALRIGILKRLLKNDNAFLILDDAFQHSDYEKRHILVKTVCELARNGWQIIYFTMDDHILNLFRKEKNGDYIEIDLHTHKLHN